MLGEKLGEFESGALAADLRLDALLAAKASPSPALNERAAAIEAKLPPADGMPGIYALAGSGGDPAAGADIFRTHIAAQCSRCHRIGKTGDPADMSDVGPNLAGVATRRDAAYLLRALLNPSADIDPAFRMQLVTKTNGEVVAGAVLNEGYDFIEIGLGAGEPQRIAKSAIAKHEPQNVSIMPPMAGILSPAEVRDVLAFLKMLK
ncbi:MAG: c-type cytochrome [Verrucomicrobiales bacterium]